MTTLASTPLITFHVKPLRCGSAPTAPAPPRKGRVLLPASRQARCVENFHASWPALPAGKGKEVKCPRLSLSVQHETLAGVAPSPLAVTAFQRAFQKMKSASSSRTLTKETKKPAAPLTAPPAVAAPAAPAPAPELHKKQLKPTTIHALERLHALAPGTPSERKMARRRIKQISPSHPQNATFAKTASSAKLQLGSKGALLMGMGVARSPSNTLLNQQMRRVRSSGSRGNLTSMLY